MSRRKLIILLIPILAALLCVQAWPAQAQSPTPAPENDANCVACHEHEYYLYDTGKWYCLCDAPMHCVYCHGGRTDTLDKDEAHVGLVLYPTRHHAERCQSCHAEDYMARVVTFETVAGVSAPPRQVSTATAAAPSPAPVEQPPTGFSSLLNRLSPWQMAALAVLAGAFVAVLFYGYRCWKADCLAKIST